MAHFAAYNTTRTTGADSPLIANADVTLGPINTAQEGQICGSVFADQAGTIYIEQSFDGGDNFDISAAYPVSANAGAGFTETIIAPVSQVRYVNGGTNQGAMRLYVRCFGLKASGS